MNVMAMFMRNTPDNRGNLSRFVAAFLLVTVFSSCGFLKKNDQPRQDLSKLQLKEDIISFTFSKVPKIYFGLVNLDNEIVLIDKELERLKEIEAEFPNQKRIIITESNNWKKVKKALLSSLSNLEKDVEKIYVTYLVNKENGVELINKNVTSLLERINKTLQASRPHTKRLNVVKEKSLVAKLKDKLLG